MVSTTWLLLTHCIICLSYAMKIDRVTHSGDTVGRQRQEYRTRFKRIVNLTDIAEISIEDHEEKYPFIVGINTLQHMYDGKAVKKAVRCTGTMLASRLILTTSYCVRNAITMKVFKRGNPGKDVEHEFNAVPVKIITISDANKYTNTGDERTFPNPLFYGDMINKFDKWQNMYGRDDTRTANVPTKNVAIVYVEEPLLLDNETSVHYPIIDADPSKFFSKNRTAEIFGWCHMGVSNDTTTPSPDNGTSSSTTKKPTTEMYENPKLTMINVKVMTCFLDWIYQHHLCIDRLKYEHAFCELDQGGPVILQGGEDDKKPAMKMSQAMMIKKYQRIIAANSKTRKITTTVPVENMPFISRQGRNDTNETSSEKKPPPSLIAMVNTDRAHGYLTYLWPYADWIYATLHEFGIRPTAMPPCPTTVTTEEAEEITKSPQIHIESYYDYMGAHGDSKQIHKVDIPCHASTVVLGVRLQIVIIVAYTIYSKHFTVI